MFPWLSALGAFYLFRPSVSEWYPLVNVDVVRLGFGFNGSGDVIKVSQPGNNVLTEPLNIIFRLLCWLHLSKELLLDFRAPL